MDYYKGTGKPGGLVPENLPTSKVDEWKDASGYIPAPGLVSAVNVALLLGQPLLLTGAPGSGKTELIYNLALEFDVARENVLDYVVKSTSSATDLFYVFDHARQFRDAARGKDDLDPVGYLTLNPLGRAIIMAQDSNSIAAEYTSLVESASEGFPPNAGADRRRRVFVLIDEIDKAPRDIPNDILSEIDKFEFQIPEMAREKSVIPRFKASPEFRPVVVFTSNSEKQLPETFLRRCVYYHIEKPDADKLREIVGSRFSSIGRIEEKHPYNDALTLFLDLQSERSQLHKRPGTAELMSWTAVLETRIDLKSDSIRKQEHRAFLVESLSALLKTESDLDRGTSILNRWISRTS